MARLKEILEPGERELIRVPGPAQLDWRQYGLQLLVPITVVVATQLSGVGNFENREYRLIIGMLTAATLFGIAVSAIPVLIRNTCWRVVVTDRRVLVSKSCLFRNVTVIKRSKIVHIERDTARQSLVFHLDGHSETVLFPYHDQEDEILVALDMHAESVR